MTNHTISADLSQLELSTPSKSKKGARYATIGARVLLGLTFAFSGVMGLIHAQQAEGIPPKALALASAFASAGYFIPLLSGIEAVAGLFLLANRFVPLALTLLAPIVVNIVAFHVFLAPQGLPIAIVVFALEVSLAYAYRSAFRGVLAARS